MKILFATILLLISACAEKQVANTPTPPPTEPPKAEAPTKKETTKAVKAKAVTPSGDVTCKSGENVRSIAVVKSESGGCEVQYTKDGATNTAASAQSDSSYCDSVKDKITKNLTDAGFTCE